MYIKEVLIENVRNIKQERLETIPDTNYFFGKNAAGKTAILEAIYLLCRARSFRNPKLKELIRTNQDQLRVTAKLTSHEQKEDKNIGIESNKRETRIRFAGETVKKISEQAKNLPIFIFTPDSQNIITGRPKDRRRWLDWSMFHVEHDYMKVWKDYHAALRHRNILLRKNKPAKQFLPWEAEITKNGEKLEIFRLKYIKSLQKQIDIKNETIFPGIRTEYLGVAGKLGEVLQEGRENDRIVGHTQKGPHRTDVGFFFNDQNAGNTLSRGQIKLFSAALTAAQIRLYIECQQQSPILLIDDIAAELDVENRLKTVELFTSIGLQVFINATERKIMEEIQTPIKMFHVEHGRVRPA